MSQPTNAASAAESPSQPTTPTFADGRATVFARIREQLGVQGQDRQAARAAALDYIAQSTAGPQPAIAETLTAETLLARVQAQTLRMQSTYAEIQQRADLPAEIARYLSEHALPPTLHAWPEFADLDWAAAGLSIFTRPVQATDLVGLTSVFAAVAETGTLAVVSGEQTPTASSLLPETHIALVRRSQIVAYMEDVFALITASDKANPANNPATIAMPRALSFISGPSRTGDIEQTIVLGAHGPYRVHVIALLD